MGRGVLNGTWLKIPLKRNVNYKGSHRCVISNESDVIDDR